MGICNISNTPPWMAKWYFPGTRHASSYQGRSSPLHDPTLPKHATLQRHLPCDANLIPYQMEQSQSVRNPIMLPTPNKVMVQTTTNTGLKDWWVLFAGMISHCSCVASGPQGSSSTTPLHLSLHCLRSSPLMPLLVFYTILDACSTCLSPRYASSLFQWTYGFTFLIHRTT